MYHYTNVSYSARIYYISIYYLQRILFIVYSIPLYFVNLKDHITLKKPFIRLSFKDVWFQNDTIRTLVFKLSRSYKYPLRMCVNERHFEKGKY